MSEVGAASKTLRDAELDLRCAPVLEDDLITIPDESAWLVLSELARLRANHSRALARLARIGDMHEDRDPALDPWDPEDDEAAEQVQP